MKRKSFLLRLRPEVHDALQKWAADELRSLNGQIEYILSRQLKREKRWPRKPSGSPDRNGS